MELQIVNKEIAIQLKELGFDWEVNAYYKEELYEQVKNELYKDCCSNNFSQYIDDISAPTQALVCKWLRDVHNINISIISISTKELQYYYDIIQLNVSHDIPYNTYELAEEAGILKAIEILKSK